MTRFAASILCLAVVLSCKVPGYFKVGTDGMAPTLRRGDEVMSEPLTNVWGSIKRFDIVIFRPPNEVKEELREPEITLIQRIVGLPGETISLKGGKVFINGQPLAETFEHYPSDDDFGPITIPEKEYFLMGDNRSDSFDSRYWKRPTVGEQQIIFRVTRIMRK